jgi:glycosyltransferase involved in cell wall biosynthesis
VFSFLRRHRHDFDQVVVQGDGIAALAANLAERLNATPTTMLLCKPELIAPNMLAGLNARVGLHYVVLNDYLASVVHSHGTHKPVSVVPIYGVDTKLFNPTPEPKSEIKRRLGLPARGSIIFFSSRIMPEEDAKTLLAAVRALLDSGRELWLFHRSANHQTLLDMAALLGLSDRILTYDALQFQNRLADDYQAADMCVQASLEEGLEFSVLEAMACGTPVIAADFNNFGDLGGFRKERVHDGRTGWRYPVGDPIRLAHCIAAVIDDPVEAARRAEEGLRLMCLSFNGKAVLSQFETALRIGYYRMRIRDILQETSHVDDYY